jgi:hypothetical protein
MHSRIGKTNLRLPLWESEGKFFETTHRSNVDANLSERQYLAIMLLWEFWSKNTPKKERAWDLQTLSLLEKAYSYGSFFNLCKRSGSNMLDSGIRRIRP